MKYIFIIMVLWLPIENAYPNEGEHRSLDARIEDLAAFTQENADTSWLTDEARPMIVERLLKELSDADREKRCEIEMKLVTIGHLATIKRLAANMKAGEDYRGLEFSATEAAIPCLMDVVRTGQSDIPGFGDGDVFLPSVRVRAAKIVLDVIRSRKAFPPETVHWFSKLDPINDTEENLKTLGLLETWWRGNQVAIEAQKYADATWLPDMSEGKRTRSELRAEQGEYQDAVSGMAGKDQGTTRASVPEAESVAGDGTLWIYVVSALVTCVILCLVKLRSSQRKS
jgi:hypothetical protein